MLEKFKRIFRPFTEAQSRVNDDLLPAEPGRNRLCHSFLKVQENFPLYGTILQVADLHILGFPPHVHENDSSSGIDHGLQHPFIKAHRADIVDDFCSGSKGFPGDFRLCRINGYGNVNFSNQSFYYRQNTVRLFFQRDGIRSRPRRFTADIQNIGPLLDQLNPMSHGGIMAKIFSSIGKGIRSHIKNAHDKSLFSKDYFPFCRPQDNGFQGIVGKKLLKMLGNFSQSKGLAGELFRQTSQLFFCSHKDCICPLNGAGYGLPCHGCIPADREHLLFEDIGNLALKTLNQDIKMPHFRKHGFDPVRIDPHLF
ncbi:MAG: hypothetical protein A4E72_01923 [Syntrophus sp. PtaU1.Bin208]|nr:MAG: hypothetical protein A4E72_01923 [Syntrophus sp. PtaU1.Bin208]